MDDVLLPDVPEDMQHNPAFQVNTGVLYTFKGTTDGNSSASIIYTQIFTKLPFDPSSEQG